MLWVVSHDKLNPNEKQQFQVTYLFTPLYKCLWAMTSSTEKGATMTQCERIIDYMNRFGSISPVEAFSDLGVMRLASRICDIEKSGTPITRNMECTKNRYGEKVHYMRYSLGDKS